MPNREVVDGGGGHENRKNLPLPILTTYQQD
jgi:hypothetical protein